MATARPTDGCRLERCGASDAVSAASQVEGWLTDEQAHQLWHSAASLEPEQRIVEIGSFRGRSTVALALAAPEGVEILAIDPHSGVDRAPQETKLDLDAGAEDGQAFARNLRRFGVTDRVSHIQKPSSHALGDVHGGADVLFIDGAHGFRSARQDIVLYGDLVPQGGTMLVHDSFSSVGVTLALISTLFSSGQFRYVGRTGSLAVYQRAELHPAERLRNLGLQLAQLPWFARNLVIKGLIVLHQDGLARALGHTTGPWPY
ncbi:MAG TPA: class I SAM-dependent methyltransferase [Acidimicrobiales bacterium]|nr:class I SAM-dependent methyltransferase [Acidimicrobiales bacterium]